MTAMRIVPTITASILLLSAAAFIAAVGRPAAVHENLRHAGYMKTHPHMAHHNPNAITLTPFDGGELLWKFSKPGTLKYGCLIHGHREAGMHGTVVVK